MDIEDTGAELALKLRRLDASTAGASVSFGYDGMLGRHAAKQARSRRRLKLARGTAGALVIALVGLSLWRLDHGGGTVAAVAEVPAPAVAPEAVQPRIVRADTYLAVAALEDHIASLDDALNDARLRDGRADIARLERTRAELVDSWTRVRYAEMVSANF
jgi:hypothetical protein